MSERHGLFVMLVLGESVISIVIQKPLALDSHYYLVVFFAFSLVFNLQINFYDTLPPERNYDLLKKSSFRYHMAMALHLFLSFALLLTGAAIKIAVKNASEKRAGMDVEYKIQVW